MIEEIHPKKVMQMIIMAVKTLLPHQKKTDVVMLFLSLCVGEEFGNGVVYTWRISKAHFPLFGLFLLRILDKYFVTFVLKD